MIASFRLALVLLLTMGLGLIVPAHHIGWAHGYAPYLDGATNAPQISTHEQHEGNEGHHHDSDDCSICLFGKSLGTPISPAALDLTPAEVQERLRLAAARPAQAEVISCFFGRAPPPSI